MVVWLCLGIGSGGRDYTIVRRGMEVIFEMDSAIVQAKVARVKQMLNPREGGPSQVLVEVKLEAFRNGKKT